MLGHGEYLRHVTSRSATSLAACCVASALIFWTATATALGGVATGESALAPTASSSSFVRPLGPGRPTVVSVKHFRRRFGLDLDLNGQVAALNRRAKKLVAAWLAGDPFALRTARQWGSPLRHSDAQELRYRKKYVDQARSAIPGWIASRGVSTYAGLYVDERKGGVVQVGFTGDQESQLALMLSEVVLLAPERVTFLPVFPTHTLAELEALRQAVSTKDWRLNGVDPIMSVAIDVPTNRIRITTRLVAAVTAMVVGEFGADAPILVVSPRQRHLVPR